MPYTALYRKLRPKNFSEVIGQNHIVKTLINQFETNRINHSYLFCGTRGTGKTSTAKIFAKLLNCENPKHNKPCNECELCVSFQKNRSLNIFEIDAASNNSVDDIREIKEEIKYPPTKGKYKIYIIDEVHMLSIGAFNALLKTLEEPPAYIIFILATTDPQKIPVTILSRCQRFDFKRISDKDMVLAIKESIKNENIDIDIEDDALKYIASISDGAMRDALSILEQCNSFYYNEKITLENVLEILGAVDDGIFFEITDAFIDFDALKCINIIDKIILNGRDISQFITDLIKHFRNLLVSGASKENILNISNEKYENLKNQFNKKDSNYFINLISSFSEIQSKIKYSFDARIILEAECVKICTCSFELEDFNSIKEKLIYIENQMEKGFIQKVDTKNNTENVENKKIEDFNQNFRKLEISTDFKEVIDNWQKVLNNIKNNNFLFEFLKDCSPKNLEDEFLYIVSSNKIKINKIEKEKQLIEDTIAEIFNKKYQIYPILEQDFIKKYQKIATSPKSTFENNLLKEVENILPEGSFSIE